MILTRRSFLQQSAACGAATLLPMVPVCGDEPDDPLAGPQPDLWMFSMQKQKRFHQFPQPFFRTNACEVTDGEVVLVD